MSSHNPAQQHILERIKAREITPEQGVALLRLAANDAGDPTRDVLQQLKSGAVNPQQALALLRNQLPLSIGNQAAAEDVDSSPDTALSSIQQKAPSQISPPHPPIAVVGMSGRFPGAENLDQFWHNLRQGTVSVDEVPTSRWSADKYYDPQTQTPDKSPSKWGGFLKDISGFDPLFFSLSPREAELMDPAQRLFLTQAWRALEHAGLAGESISRERCGVFVGCGPSDYLHYLQERGVPLDAAAFLGNSNPIMAARIAFLLNLHGPAMAIDTACSSSLVAVQLACESLASGSSSIAIAGGVSVFVTPQTHLLSGAAGMLSPTGRCYTFDARADGIAPSEGVGVVILKTLADAQRDGDHIHGVIVASGLNQDGKSNGITAPSATSQAALQSRIYERFGVDPRQITLLEAHGTGTRLGDPIEISALTDAFARVTAEQQFCGIGSVKANIGHASAAAGIAGLLKLLLCLRHREMVPLAGFSHANPHIDFANSPFYPIEKAAPWSNASPAPRMAALNSFGFSGTNAHLVLAEAPPALTSTVQLPASRWLFPLSAREPEALTQIASNLLQWLEAHPTVPLANVAYSLMRRPVFRHRSAIFTDDRFALQGFLSQISKAQSPQVTSEHAQAFIDSGKPIWRGAEATLIDLPGYPLEEKAYWVPQALAQSSRLMLAPSHPLLEQVDVTDGLRFTSILHADDMLLRDHQVQGRRILPGVVYLEMAIAAARALIPSQIWAIHDLVWLAPLQVDDAAVALHLNLKRDASGFTFEFSSETVASALCKGRLSAEQEAQENATFDIAALMSQCPQQRGSAEVQQFFQSHGISYGKSFQSLVQHHAGKDMSVGILELAQPSATHGCYRLDPFLADAALQSAALFFADTASGPLLPSSLQGLQVIKPLPQKLLACAKRTGPLRFDLALLDEAGKLCARFENLGLRKAAKRDQDTPRCFAQPPVMPAASDDQAFLTGFADLEALIPARLSNCLDLAALDAIAILPRYAKLSSVLRRMLTDPRPPLEPQQVEARKAQLCQEVPTLRPFVRLLWDCTAAISEILSGQKDATAVLFPNGSAADIAGIYSGNPPADRFHLALAALAKQAVSERADQALRILEIGAGTGATTAIVLNTLRPYQDRLEYTFSDISPAFLRSAQAQFSTDAAWLDFQLLDLEQPSAAQGFSPQSYDIIIAANVVHATRDIKASLQAIRQLLKPGGLLLLNELTSVTTFATLTFGLTDGWWRFEDGDLRLEDAPLLAESSWHGVLKASGFADFNAFGHEWCGSGNLDQRLMAAVTLQTQQPQLAPQIKPELTSQQASPQQAKPPMVTSATVTRDDDLRYVSEILADILKLQAQQLVPDRSLDEYGVDSLVTQQIVTALAADFGELPATLVFEYPSIAKLAGFLRDTQPQALDRAIKARFPTQVAVPLFASKSDTATATLTRATQPQTKPSAQDDIAIIGLAGRYPLAANVDTFWQNLIAARDCIRKVPEDRWNAADHATPIDHGDTSRAGFIDDVDCFDARFFHISPREADSMDPQERLFLETAWATIEHAGYDPFSLGKQQRIGVFAGVMNSTYAALAAAQAGQTGSHRAQTAYWSVANRVSFYLDLRGPSLAVDSACSSSLTAIHLACASIASGECDMALAGGVNLILDPSHLACLAEMRMLSPSAKCRAFGQGADGFVDGEGVGAVLLAPLSQAVTDGAHILAVIKGSAINSGGRTTGFTVPSPEAQGEVVREAIVNAGIEPESLDYVEAHGTGTALGDPIEIAGLRAAFRKLARRQSCAVGSVKSNIGHLESAAGIASLTKVLKQLEHGRLAPSIHADQLNAKIDLNDNLFHIQRELATWPSPQLEVDGQPQQFPRCAGISSFGAGGANAHLVVAEYVPGQVTRNLPQGELLIPLSARTQERLDKQIEQLLAALAGGTYALADLAFTLQTGRTPMQVRGAVMAGDQVALQQRLQALHSFEYSDTALHVWRSQTDEPQHQQQRITLTSDSDLERVASLWVQGATVDWQPFWRAFDGKRVPLPTYPFERTRHWLKSAKARQPEIKSVRHSLLGEVDPQASLSDGLTLRLNLRDADPLACEHRVNGQGIYPAAAQLCLLHEAWARIGRVGALQLRNIIWAQPLTATSDAQLTLKRQDEGLAFHIKADKSTISSGLCLPAASISDDLAVPSLPELQARFTIMQNPAEIYTALRAIGIEHGEPYQVMRQYASHAHETLAELECGSDSDAWSPYLLDGLLQTIAAIGELAQKPMLPYRVEAVHFLAAPQPRCWAYAQKTSTTSFRLVLYAQDAVPLLVMNHLEARPLPTAPLYWSYTPHWTRQSVSATAGDREKITAVMYAAPAKALAERIAQTSGNAETRLVPWPADSDAWQALIKAGQQAPQVVLLIADGDTSGTQGLLQLCQALVKAGYGRDRVGVHVVTRRACAVTEGDAVSTFAAACHGFVASAAREFPDWRWSLHDLDTWDAAEQAPLPFDSAQSGKPLQLLARRHGYDFRRILRPTRLPTPTRSPYRVGGMYVIAGGNGGIGQALALDLAKRFKAKLVLLGRGSATDTLKQTLTAIADHGGTAIYQRADLTDQAQVEVAIATAVEQFGKINGAFHTALVLRDCRIVNMSLQDLNAALAPKVTGTIHLQQAIKDHDLDFLCLFSSAQSFLGNAGQANYAAASTFIDAWAHDLKQRSDYPVRVFNWGFWSEVGSVATPEYHKRLSQMGILPLTTREGLAMCEQALAAPATQIVPFKAEARFLKSLNIVAEEHYQLKPMRQSTSLKSFATSIQPSPVDAEQRQKLDQVADGLATLDHISAQFFAAALMQLQAAKPGDRFVMPAEVIAQQHRLVNAALPLLAAFDLLQRDADDSYTWGKPTTPKTDSLLQRFPDLAAYTQLLLSCAPHYVAILCGQKLATDVLFPSGSLTAATGIYRGNALSDGLNAYAATAAQRFLSDYCPADRSLRVLEIGGGTGGTTDALLPQLSDLGNRMTYHFTDIGRRFVLEAEKRLASSYPFVQFATLDIENPKLQISCDVVIAANVLHATSDMRQTLDHVRALLRPGGLLILNEVTAVSPFATFTFGLLEGWQRHEDNLRLPSSPLLHVQGWQALLKEQGFLDARALGFEGLDQHIILAQNGPCYLEDQATAKQVPRTPNRPKLQEKNQSASPDLQTSKRLIEQQIVTAMAKTLEVASDELQPDLPHAEFGLDSILAMEVIEHLNQEHGWDMSPTDLFNYATIRDLAEHLATTLEAPLSEPAVESTSLTPGDREMLDILEQWQAGILTETDMNRLIED